MKVLTIKECHRELKQQGHAVSLSFLYRMRDRGEIPMVDGKTSPETILATLTAALGIPASPVPSAGPRQPTDCITDALPRLRGHKVEGPSNGQPRNGGTATQTKRVTSGN